MTGLPPFEAGAHIDVVIDATGRHTRMTQLANVPVLFDGAAAPVPLDFLQNPAAAAAEPILVPQELLRRGWAMRIDLERGELRFGRGQALGGELFVHDAEAWEQHHVPDGNGGQGDGLGSVQWRLQKARARGFQEKSTLPPQVPAVVPKAPECAPSLIPAGFPSEGPSPASAGIARPRRRRK